MFSKKKSDLTKREKEIRSYILEEYANGKEKEAREILGG